VADIPAAQLLWFGREAEESIDLAFGKQLFGLTVGLVTHLTSSLGSSPT
jgi:hypothetical protein